MKIQILIKPGSKRGPLVETCNDGSLLVFVRETAIENKANQALIEVLSKHFNKAKTKISITKGQKSRIKTVEIKD